MDSGDSGKDFNNDEKTKLLQATCKDLGLQTDVAVRSSFGPRWTIEVIQDPNFPDFCTNMIKLERALQEITKRTVDLRLKRVSDKNMREKRNVLSSKAAYERK